MCVWGFIQKAPGGTLGTYKHIDHTNGMPCGGDPVSRSHPIRMELWDGVQNPPLLDSLEIGLPPTMGEYLLKLPESHPGLNDSGKKLTCSGQGVGLGQGVTKPIPVDQDIF